MATRRPALPVDGALPRIIEALREHGRLVLQAPPASGKTTAVPPALLEAGFADTGAIVVLQPRRLAARLAAGRVAQVLGQAVGQQVGYQVRHDQCLCAATRLLFVTQGLFLRRLLAEPGLPGVAAVLLDEFHERHLDGDFLLAALQRLRRSRRPDLRLVVMSATLQASAVARVLDDAPTLELAGQLFPVDIEHLPRPDEAPLEQQIRRAVARLVDGSLAGDVLVFLPGAAEIRRAREALQELAARHDLELCMLHGELPPEQQQRAVQPGARRKIILSTNVAETSITVEGVVAVLDSGLARVPARSPWSGLPALELRKVSRASCVQRTGRAGRLRPGRCLRLFTEADYLARPEQELPEIQRLDLAELWLQALGLVGEVEIASLPWLDPPPPAAAQAARDLLSRLGAVDGDGSLTDRGRWMLQLPVHPRLGRLLDEARSRGVPWLGCAAAALLSERDIVAAVPGTAPRASVEVSDSDLLDRLHLLRQVDRARIDDSALHRAGLRPQAVHAVLRTLSQLERLLPGAGDGRDEDETALLHCALAAYPDRVAQRRPGGRELLLCGGGEAELDPASSVQGAGWLVALDATAPSRGRHRRSRVHLASAIEADWLLDLFAEHIVDEEELRFDEDRGRVVRSARLRYGLLVLTEQTTLARGDPRAAELLAEHALRSGLGSFDAAAGLTDLRGRLDLACRLDAELELPVLDDTLIRQLVVRLALSADDLGALRRQDLALALLQDLTATQRRALATLCPETIALPGRRRAPVHYPEAAPPFVASAMQDFFGLTETPRIGGGRVTLQLQLLAPNHRAVQVTQDLAGFWEVHYPALRRQLMRRYPRHAWAEDPRTATAPARGRPR
ncbi:MAG: ATP-dependent helicase HrpB [Pseudomonadota bacterium]